MTRDRFDQLAHIRRLADNDWGDKDYGHGEEDMDTTAPANRRPGSRYRNQVGLRGQSSLFLPVLFVLVVLLGEGA